MCRVLCGHMFSDHLGKCQGAWLLDHKAREYFICKKLPNCLPKWLYHFAFPSAVDECSCCSSPPSALGIVSVLDFGHFKVCSGISLLFSLFSFLFKLYQFNEPMPGNLGVSLNILLLSDACTNSYSCIFAYLSTSEYMMDIVFDKISTEQVK